MCGQALWNTETVKERVFDDMVESLNYLQNFVGRKLLRKPLLSELSHYFQPKASLTDTTWCSLCFCFPPSSCLSLAINYSAFMIG